jgi:hypothetical protein
MCVLKHSMTRTVRFALFRFAADGTSARRSLKAAVPAAAKRRVIVPAAAKHKAAVFDSYCRPFCPMWKYMICSAKGRFFSRRGEAIALAVTIVTGGCGDRPAKPCASSAAVSHGFGGDIMAAGGI